MSNEEIAKESGQAMAILARDRDYETVWKRGKKVEGKVVGLFVRRESSAQGAGVFLCVEPLPTIGFVEAVSFESLKPFFARPCDFVDV